MRSRKYDANAGSKGVGVALARIAITADVIMRLPYQYKKADT